MIGTGRSDDRWIVGYPGCPDRWSVSCPAIATPLPQHHSHFLIFIRFLSFLLRIELFACRWSSLPRLTCVFQYRDCLWGSQLLCSHAENAVVCYCKAILFAVDRTDKDCRTSFRLHKMLKYLNKSQMASLFHISSKLGQQTTPHRYFNQKRKIPSKYHS